MTSNEHKLIWFLVISSLSSTSLGNYDLSFVEENQKDWLSYSLYYFDEIELHVYETILKTITPCAHVAY